ncbi:hypothetical protein ACS127_07700 [Amphibacillus sp. Q70]
MRKGLIVLFLLLIIAFGLIGVLQDDADMDVKIEEQALNYEINS